MKKMTHFFLFSMVIFVFLSGCASNNQIETSTNEDIFQYEGTFIGNNSAVTNLISQLKHGEKVEQVSLQTTKDPYV